MRLRAALAAAGPRAGAALLAPDGSVPLAALVAGTVLPEDRVRVAGRSVLLATDMQRAAGLAMVDLDGLAARLTICPPDLRPEHRAALLADAEAEAIVTDGDPAPLLEHGLPVLRLAPRPVPLAGRAPARATEWVMATSGTSGAPKVVVHTLEALTAAIAQVPPGRPMVWATFYDIRRYGGLQIFLRAMLAGCSLVLSGAGEALGDHLGRLAAAGVTHISGTPSHWRRLLMSEEIGRIRPATVRLSGEIADQPVLDGLAAAYPQAAVGHAYASTEAGVGFEVNDGLEGFPAAYLDRDEPCAMRIVEGALQLRSARLGTRYLGADPPALRDADGFVDTGDMVERRGDRLHFVGRRGGIINVGGLKVHPEEIEAVINRHEAVTMSLVRARRSPITGAIVVADIVLAPGAAEAPVREAVMAACRASLATHKVPAALRVVPALDVTPAGKLARAS